MQTRSAPQQSHLGRCEHRMDVVMSGRLEEVCADPICDRVTIKNISAHGARVISERPWPAHEHVHLAEPGGEQHLDAEVVYCEHLPDNRYAVGLKFESHARRRVD